jgi:hypothetical protein
MDIILWFVGICIYAMIGGFLSAILGWSDDGFIVAVVCIFWPVIIPISILVNLIRFAVSFGEFLSMFAIGLGE